MGAAPEDKAPGAASSTRGAGGALRRMIRARPRPVAEPVADVERLIGRAIGRAAQNVAGLPLSLHSLRQQRLSLAELIDLPNDLALVAMLEGPDETLGLMVLDPDMLDGLIQHLTTRAVRQRDAPRRPPTRVDAVMAAPLIDRLLFELDSVFAAGVVDDWLPGFRYASFLDGVRPLGLVLEDTGYRVFTLGLDLGAPGRRAGMVLALPARGRRRGQGGPRSVATQQAVEAMTTRPPAPDLTDAAGQGRRAADARAAAWAHALEDVLLAAPAVLTAQLPALRLPLDQVLTLAPGVRLALGQGTLDAVRLTARDGRAVGRGTLGQRQGQRAVRLGPPLAPAAAQPDGPEPPLPGHAP